MRFSGVSRSLSVLISVFEVLRKSYSQTESDYVGW
jgi:hypothetical protein